MNKLTRLFGGAVCGALLFTGCNGDIIDTQGARPRFGGEGVGTPVGPNPMGPNNSPNSPNTPVMVPPERPPEMQPGVNAPGAAIRCEKEVVAPRVLRRLTNPELEASLRSAFGLDEAAWKTPSLIPDPASGDGFTNNSDRLSIGEEHASRLMDAGKDIAEVITSATHLPRVLPCAATGGDPCASTFLDTIGSKLFRRPLSATEKQRYMALSAKVKTGGGDFKAWVYWTTVALVKSPNTLYRSELGEAGAGGTFKLTPYEVASSLSFAYTGGPPTPELLQLAAAGRLSTADDVEAAARGLALSAGQLRPAFKAQMLRFADQWLGLSPLANISKDKMLFADFTPEVQDAMAEEIRGFLSSVWFDDKGKPADLLTAPYTFLNATLSKFYGYGNAGPSLIKVMRPAKWGSGLLAQGAVLSIAAANNSTSPTKRGHLVRERLLCTSVPPPPKAVAPIPEPTAAQTTRQRYEQIHVAADECKGCHALMDPIGFGLEHLNATGRYQEKEGAFDIDDRGSITGTSAGTINFKGPDELGQALAKLPEVADCLADFTSAYAFGLNHSNAACIAKTAGDELREGKVSYVDFYIRMARAESFRTRKP